MIVIDIFKIILNIIYIPFKWKKTKHKILFLSRQTNEPSLEYQRIIEKLKKEHDKIEIVVLTKKLERSFLSLLKNFFFLFRQMYHLATSKIVITDGYSIPISILNHKKSLIIIQLWHANGIIKKIGLQTLPTRTKIQKKLALKMNMHKNYTYVIASSKKTAKIFEEAFGVSKQQIRILGTPMLDYLFEKKNEKQQLRKKYHLSTTKKTIVYLPTYRTTPIAYETIKKDFDFEHYQLVMKPHPVDHHPAIDENIIFIEHELAEDIISLADYVITDYSNVAFEAVLTGKKTYFYVYDYQEYKTSPGLNVDIEKELKEYSFTKFQDLMNHIKHQEYSYEKINQFTKQHVSTFDGKCTDRIVTWILELMEGQ